MDFHRRMSHRLGIIKEILLLEVMYGLGMKRLLCLAYILEMEQLLEQEQL